MQSLSLHETASQNSPADLAGEISNLESLLSERRVLLVSLQQELREFKARYTQTVGGPMSELSEVERALKEAEAQFFEVEVETEEVDVSQAAERGASASGKTALRKLFWSVARLFHPDHAADDRERERRHAVMAEASRAYQEGDVESLHVMLGDEQLQFFCVTQEEGADDGEEDATARLLRLKGELLTVEYGIKRIRQDGLYRLKLKVDEDAAMGRDALALMAESVGRQIIKARRRLEHLSMADV